MTLRSTNERARHNSLVKRLPAAAAPARQSSDDDQLDDEDPDIDLSGLLSDMPADLTTIANIRTAPARITTTVLPPVAKTPAIPTTTVPDVTRPAVATQPKPVAATTPLSTPPKPVTTPSTTLATPTTSSSPTANRGVASTSAASAAPEISPSGSPSSRGSHTVSPGAIGAIVAVMLVILIATAAFFVRKVHQRRRALKRNTWGAGLVPTLENKRQSQAHNNQSQNGRPMSTYGGGFEQGRLANVSGAPHGGSQPFDTYASSPTSHAYAAHGPPGLTKTSYNSVLPHSPMSPYGVPSIPPLSLRSVAPSVSAVGPAPAGELAVVARTFIPSLPDELHISNGEQIRVLSAYDDGWALCANARGDQGVVPLECLERKAGFSGEMQLHPQNGIGEESNRTSRRMSSLAPNAPGMY